MVDTSAINGGFLTFAEAVSTSAEPLVGELRLTTDQSEIVLSSDRQTAALLADELALFLGVQLGSK